jgi:hypothetical protein
VEERELMSWKTSDENIALPSLARLIADAGCISACQQICVATILFCLFLAMVRYCFLVVPGCMASKTLLGRGTGSEKQTSGHPIEIQTPDLAVEAKRNNATTAHPEDAVTVQVLSSANLVLHVL